MIGVSSPLFLLLLLTAVIARIASSGDNLVRKKREWILPPRPLLENEDYTQQDFIAKIRSDAESSMDIEYALEGIGANERPYGLFIVDPKTGFIRVTKVLDREVIDTYNLSGVAKYKDGSHAEKKIDIRIKVVDVNDNPPVFGDIKPGSVKELSAAGTSVMKITATDADEPNNPNSQIAYSLLEQNPPHDMFEIRKDGTIYVKNSALDRERADQYTLKVKGQDLNGGFGGHSATSTVTINVEDVNDNHPTLEKKQFSGSIDENTKNVEVMRIKAQDLDLKATDNWITVFDIVKGNEAGYFSIKTDPITNEGILMLDKEVDYEDVKDLKLGLAIRNKAPFFDGSGPDAIDVNMSGGGASSSSGASGGGGEYEINIKVNNQREGASFDPKVKAIPVSEGGGTFDMNQVIGTYWATDGDTGKQAENVRYAKGWDPDNWLTIDPKTAQIKLNKMPDRESPYLVNGTYMAKVLCISDDMPSKTSTGTIAIQVEDFNDNCPILTSDIETICTPADAIIVNARDEDAFPNGAPFDFAIIPEETQGKWQVENFNESAVILRAVGAVWPGSYEVSLLVKDQQGEACPQPQKVTVQVCTCEDGVTCGTRGAGGQPSRWAKFGPAGIGLLFLGLLLLPLLLLMLLFCQCGGVGGVNGDFAEIPFASKPHMVNYHTEGQGENTEVPLMIMPSPIDENTSTISKGMGRSGSRIEPRPLQQVDGCGSGGFRERTWIQGLSNGSHYERRESRVGGGMFDGMALQDQFLGQYYTQKVTSENENLGLKDSLLVFDYEGQGSSAGSVGCCSLLESDNDLHFLDDLGAKFKTLAEVCSGKKIPTQVKQVLTPLPSASINTQTSVSTSMTSQQQPPPPKLQPTVARTVVRDSSERSQVIKESTATVRQGMTVADEGMLNQGQMVLLQPQQQQQIYYTTGPMLQPAHFVVQPQIQNTVLLAEAPATNLQSMVMVNGLQTGPAQGMVVQGQTMMSGGQAQGPHMVLVESCGIQGGGGNVIHNGTLSGSQTMMMVESKVPAGSMSYVQGGTLQGGTLRSEGLSGSQRVLVAGGSTSSGGPLVQVAGGLSQRSVVSGSQRVHHSKDSPATGSQINMVRSSTTTVNSTPTYRKVMVQETRERH